MQNDIGEHKLANPEKYESHKTGTCGECQRLGRDLMEMIQLKNNIMAERDFYFKLEAEKQKCCQELLLKISEMQQQINFWMKAKDEVEQEHKHEFQADTDGHPYCTKCGKYAYSNAYKPTISGTYADKKDTYADDSIKLPVPIVKPSEVLTALLCGPVGNVVVGSIEEKRMLREAIQKIKEAGL